MEKLLAETGIPITPATTAVVVIDMQHDFVAPGGALDGRGAAVERLRRIIPPLVRFLEAARRYGVTVVPVQTVRDEADISPSLRNLWQRTGVANLACRRDSWGAEIIPELAPQPGDLLIQKKRYSAFVGTELDQILRERGIKTLIVTGVSTNVCVESTWRHGFMLDYFIVVPEDLVAASSELRLHQAALDNLNRYFGITTDSETLIRAWAGD